MVYGILFFYISDLPANVKDACHTKDFIGKFLYGYHDLFWVIKWFIKEKKILQATYKLQGACPKRNNRSIRKTIESRLQWIQKPKKKI